MSDVRVLAIDQGTTNTKAILVNAAGTVIAKASCPLKSTYPRPGWAEQSAAGIWNSVHSAIVQIAGQVELGSVDAIAIANQRETLVVWDARTSEPLCPAIIWQCRRTAHECAELIRARHNAEVLQATGLGINPLFPASKLAWVIRNVAPAAEALKSGNLRAGTVDSWLLWNLTGGKSFKTDHSNAARTQLFDIHTLAFDQRLGDIFGAPVSCLPEAVPSDSVFGHTAERATILPAGVPISVMIGDSHAALFGHGIREPGKVKATFGTGSSLMALTDGPEASANGLSKTIAWTDRNGTAYALEGNITVSAQAAEFAARLLGLGKADALSKLAQTVQSADGVSFVPALAGLGAPYWDDGARGTITGMTHGTQPAHLARATFEAIAHQIADVFEAIQRDIERPLEALHADGGASSNDFLMQLQADLLGRPVLRAEVEEVGALGAASMAFAALSSGASATLRQPASFEPAIDAAARDQARTAWAAAVAKARS